MSALGTLRAGQGKRWEIEVTGILSLYFTQITLLRETPLAPRHVEEL